MTDLLNNLPQPDKTVQFYFRCQSRLNTKHGILLQYLNQEELIFSKKERILQALLAYWLPLAYKKRGGLSREQLRQIAEQAIYGLRIHITYLEETFGIASQPLAPSQRHLSIEALLDDSDRDEPEDHDDEDAIVMKWK